MKITAIYPGTFDPITNGHTDIVLRATRLFDQVIIAVAEDTGKRTAFNAEERVALARTVLGGIAKVEVCAFSGLVTAFTRKRGARVIIRGLRAVSDFDFEFQMTGMNAKLDPNIETVFLMAADKWQFVSSSFVKEIASLGGDVSELAQPVERLLHDCQLAVRRVDLVPRHRCPRAQLPEDLGGLSGALRPSEPLHGYDGVTVGGTWTLAPALLLSMPQLLDPKGEIGRKYGAQVTPHMYVQRTADRGAPEFLGFLQAAFAAEVETVLAHAAAHALNARYRFGIPVGAGVAGVASSLTASQTPDAASGLTQDDAATLARVEGWEGGAFPEEKLLHVLLHQFLRLLLPGHQPVLVEDHLHAILPELPGLGGHVLVDALPQLSRPGGAVEPRQRLLELHALHRPAAAVAHRGLGRRHGTALVCHARHRSPDRTEFSRPESSTVGIHVREARDVLWRWFASS